MNNTLQASGVIFKRILGNGTTVMVDRVPGSASVALSVALVGGSRDEFPETSGITHFLEHIIFKRTKRSTTLELANRIDDLGGEVNGFTGAESFCLHGLVPAERINELFGLFEEILLEPGFTERDIELEREVIRQEILEAEDDPEDASYHCFTKHFWPGCMLGAPVFGSIDTLWNFDQRLLEERLQELLLGRRLIIGCAGNVDPELVCNWADRCFSHLPTGERPSWETPMVAGGIATVSRPVSQTHLLIGQRWPALLAEDYLAGLIAVTVLGSGTSSRLFQELRERHGLAYDVEADLEAYPDSAAMIIAAITEPQNLEKSLELIASEYISIARNGPTVGELSRVVRAISAQLVMEADDLEQRLWRAINTEIHFGRYVSGAEVVNRLNAISLEDVHQVLKKWMRPERHLLVLGGNTEDSDKFESLYEEIFLEQLRKLD